MKKFNVGVVTSNRADYSPLFPLLKRLEKNKEIDLKLFVTGSHLEEKFGHTVDEIIRDGFKKIIIVPFRFLDDEKHSMSTITGDALIQFSREFPKYNLDLMILLGDRFEILAAAIASNFIGIPIAHISGGDVTTGAIDDSIRHSITKMSYLHFPGCEDSRKRIIQMGEEPNRVFNVGELGVENALNIRFLERKAIADRLHFKGVLSDFALVTFHPETNTNFKSDNVYELINAMDQKDSLNYIISYSNFDAGGNRINEIWRKESQKRKNWLLLPSFGTDMYLSLLKYSTMVIGNSSSGIIETPSFKKPTINIGKRQDGRPIAKNIICCNLVSEEICKCIDACFEIDFQGTLDTIISPFGDGNTSWKILDAVLFFLHNHEGIVIKKFYDVNFKE